MFKSLLKVSILVSLVGVLGFCEEVQTIVKKDSLKTNIGKSEFFTGSVRVTEIFGKSDYRNFGAGLVEFQKGARTAWHTHPAGQSLIVTKGKIYTATIDGKSIGVAKEGEAIICPPDIKHFHGAGFDEEGAHIALTPYKDGSVVKWLEHVSDEDYAKFIKIADESEK